jgi:O-antigen/teichoic acid export membrane protein
MNKIIKKAVRSKTLFDVGTVLGGSVLSSALGFVFVAISARKLGPADFGIFSTLLAYATFLSAIADFGISQSLVRFFHESKDKRERSIWLSTSFFAVLIISLVVAFGSSAIYHFVLKALWKHSVDYFFVLFLSIVVIAINIFFLSLFQSWQKFFKRVVIDNVFSIFRIIITFAFLYFGIFRVGEGMWAIILAFVIAIVIGLYWARQWISFKYIDIGRIKKIFNFSRWLAGVSLFGNLYGKLDILMLAWLVSAYDTGIYSAAARFIAIFPLVVSSLSSVVSPRFAQFNDKKEMNSYFKKITMLIFLVAGGMLLMIFLAKQIILIAYTQAYAEAIPIFQMLILAYVPLLISVPATNALVYYFKKPQLITIVAFVQLVGLFVLNLILIPIYKIYGVLYSLMLMNSLGMIAQYFLFIKIKNKQ